MPTPLEQIALCLEAQAGNRDALGRLLKAQTGLVKRISFGYCHAGGIETSWHLSLDDVIQESWLAVLDAVKWFDAGRGFNFNTYAAAAIRKRLWTWTRHRNTLPIGQQEEPDTDDPDHDSPLAAAPAPADPDSIGPDLLPLLSPLHRAVIRLRAAGRADREIAEALGITILKARRLAAVRLSLRPVPLPA